MTVTNPDRDIFVCQCLCNGFVFEHTAFDRESRVVLFDLWEFDGEDEPVKRAKDIILTFEEARALAMLILEKTKED